MLYGIRTTLDTFRAFMKILLSLLPYSYETYFINIRQLQLGNAILDKINPYSINQPHFWSFLFVINGKLSCG